MVQVPEMVKMAIKGLFDINAIQNGHVRHWLANFFDGVDKMEPLK